MRKSNTVSSLDATQGNPVNHRSLVTISEKEKFYVFCRQNKPKVRTRIATFDRTWNEAFSLYAAG